MPSSTIPHDDPSTSEEFRECLVWLLRRAHDNGVPVDGGWMDRTADRHRPDWGIEIYEVVKPGEVRERINDDG